MRRQVVECGSPLPSVDVRGDRRFKWFGFQCAFQGHGRLPSTPSSWAQGSWRKCVRSADGDFPGARRVACHWGSACPPCLGEGGSLRGACHTPKTLLAVSLRGPFVVTWACGPMTKL
jgi:hypothetical protein